MGNNLVGTINYSDFAEYSNHTCIILNYEFGGLPKKETEAAYNSFPLTLCCWRAGTVCALVL